MSSCILRSQDTLFDLRFSCPNDIPLLGEEEKILAGF